MSKHDKKNAEEREFPRHTVYLHADYYVVNSEEGSNAKSFETENISIGGLMFYTYDRIKVGTHLEISLFIDKIPVRFTAKVDWMKEWLNPYNCKTIFAIGLAYTRISPQAVSKIIDTTSKVFLLQRAIKEA